MNDYQNFTITKEHLDLAIAAQQKRFYSIYSECIYAQGIMSRFQTTNVDCSISFFQADGKSYVVSHQTYKALEILTRFFDNREHDRALKMLPLVVEYKENI